MTVTQNPKIGDQDVVGSGTVVLAGGEDELTIFLENMALRMVFKPSVENSGSIRIEGEHSAVIEIDDQASAFGSVVSWNELAKLDDGRTVSLRVFYQTVGTAPALARIVSYTYGAR